MPTIDQKVVQMQFDNAQFEQGVSQSLGTLEQLKKALKLEDSSSGLEDIQKSMNHFDISGLTEKIDSIAGHFTTVGRFIDRHIDEMIDKMVNGVKNFVKGISVDQINEGMSKYEQYNQSVQMIQSALPDKSIKEIEAVMTQLNEYTDLTSYSFSEMANSIGKFTSAGVDLETSEIAMEGIANWAASAGGNVREANIAMYNMSQALAAGAVKKMDWKSIELANMATKEFKEQVIDAAVSLGVLNDGGEHAGYLLKQTKKGVEQIDVTFENFSNTLTEGWFNSDVLLTVLSKYADRSTDVGKKGFEMAKIAITWTQAVDAIKDAVSTGWMNSFRYLIGDLDEAGKLFTMVSDAIIDFADGISSYRNEILQTWHEQGGYNDAIQTASNLWQVFLNIVEAVKSVLSNIIPPVTADSLLTFTKNLKDFTGTLAKDSEKLLKFIESFSNTDISTFVPLVGLQKFTSVLHEGMEGKDVYQLKQSLKNLGFEIDRDAEASNYFGESTKEALKKFQKLSGISADGIFGKQSFNELNKRLSDAGDLYEKSFTRVLNKDDFGKDVAWVQTQLANLGYLSPQVAYGGSVRKETINALEAFKEDYGIVTDELYDESVWKALVGQVNDLSDSVKQIGIPTTSLENFNKVLKKGDKGEGVKKLQQHLVDLGYLADQSMADGVYGPKTQAALEAFQKDVGITDPSEFGVYGDDTWTAFRDALYSTGDAAGYVIEKIDVIKKIKNNMGGFLSGAANIIKTLYNIITVGAQAVITIAGSVWDVISPFAAILVDLSGVLMRMFGHVDTTNGVLTTFGIIVGTIQAVLEPLAVTTRKITESFRKFLDKTVGYQDFGLFWEALLDEFSGNTVFGSIINIVTTLVDVVRNAIPIILEFFGNVGEYIGGGLILAFSWLVENVPKAVSAISGALSTVVQFIKDNDVLTKVLNVLFTIIKGIGSIITIVAIGIVSLIGDIKDAISGLWGLVTGSEAIQGVFGGIQKFFKPLTSFFKILKSTLQWFSGNKWKKLTIESLFEKMSRYNNEGGKIAKVILTIIKVIKGIGGVVAIAVYGIFKLFEAIKNGAITVWNFAKNSDFLKDKLDGIRKFFKPLTTTFGTIGDAIANLSKSGKKLTLGNILREIAKLLLASKNISKVKLAGKILKFADKISRATKDIKNFGTSIKDGIVEKYKTLSTWFTTNILPIGQKIGDFFINLYNTIKAPDDVTDPIDRIRIAFQNLVRLIGGKIWSSLENVRNFFTFDPDLSFGENIKNKLSTILGFFSGFKDKVVNKFREIYESSPFLQSTVKRIQEFGESAKTWITDKFGGAITWVSENLGPIWKKITDFFSGLYNTIKAPDDVTDPIERIKIAFQNLMGLIGEKFGKAWQGIKDFFTFDPDLTFAENVQQKLGVLWGFVIQFKDAIVKKFQEIYESSPLLQSIYEKISPIVDKIKSFVETIKKLLSGDFSGVQGWLSSLGETLSSFWDSLTGKNSKTDGGGEKKSIFDKVKDFFGGIKNFNLSGLISTAMSGLGIFALLNISSGIKDIGKRLRFGKKEDKGSGISELAKSLLIIVASIAGLTFIVKNYGAQAWSGLALIGVLVGGLMGMMLAFNKLGGEDAKMIPEQMQALGKGILSIVEAIGILTLLVKLFGVGDILIAEGLIAALIIVIYAIHGVYNALANKFGFGGGSVDFSSFTKLCAGILVLVVAVAAMCVVVRVFKPEEIWSALGFVALMLVALAGIQFALSKWGGDKEVKFGGILALAIAVGILAFVIGGLTRTISKYGSSAWGAFAMVELMIISLGAAAILLSKFGKSFKESLGSIALVVVLAVAIGGIAWVLSDSLQKIKDVDWKIAAIFIGGMILLVGAFAGLAIALGLLPKSALVAGLLGLLGVIAILAIAIEVLSGVAFDAMDNIGDGLFVFGSCMSSFSDSMSKVDTEMLSAVCTFIKDELIPVIWEIIKVGVIKDQIEAAGQALFVFGTQIKLYYKAVSAIDVEFLKSVSSYVMSDLIPMLAAITLIGPMAESLQAAGATIWDVGDSLKLYGRAVGKLDVEFLKSVSTVVTDDIIPMLNNLVTIASYKDLLEDAGSAIQTIGTKLNSYYHKVNDISTDDIGDVRSLADDAVYVATKMREIGDAEDIKNTMSQVSGALSILTRALQKAGKFGGDSENSLDSSIINQAFESMAQVEISDETMQKFGGYADKDSSGLNDFAIGITNIAEALGIYGEEISKIDVEKATTANGILDNLVDIKAKLSNPFGDDVTDSAVYGKQNELGELSDDIIDLGAALESYADNIGGLDLKQVITAGIVLDKVADVKSKLTSPFGEDITDNGIYGKQTELQSFSKDISKLGEALGSYGEYIGSLDEEQIEKGNAVLDKAVEIKDKLNNEGWDKILASKITGKKETLDQFGTEISALGRALGDYGNSIGDLDYDKIDTAKHALTIVSELQDKLPETGVVHGLIFGNKNLGKFAANMSTLGTGVANYANSVSGANFSKVDASAPILDTVGDLLAKIEKQGGLSKWIKGDKDLGAITAGMGTMGDNLVEFVGKVKNLKSDDATAPLDIIDKIITYANSIDWKSTKINGLSSIVKDYGNVIDELAKLSARTVDLDDRAFHKNNVNSLEAAQGIMSKIKEIFSGDLFTATTDKSPVSSISTMIGNMLDALTDTDTLSKFESAGEGFSTHFANGIYNNVKAPKGEILRVLTAIKNLVDFNKDPIAAIGGKISEYIGNGIYNNVKAPKAKILEVLVAIKNLVTYNEKAITAIGGNISKYIGDGIYNNRGKPKASIRTMLRECISVVREYEDDFFDVASWLDHGLAQGLRNDVWRVHNAVVYVANEAIRKFCEASKVQSPSRVFAWAGQMLDMGLVVGLESYSSQVSDASASVADDAMDSVKEELKGYSGMLANDLDTTPTIRPVLDLSEVESGALGINGMFGSQAIGVRSASLARGISRSNEETTMLKQSTSEIGLAASISTLNDRVDELGARISSMKVMINGGALVGEIITDVDRSLGRLRVRR